jgi:hypothetical protein
MVDIISYGIPKLHYLIDTKKYDEAEKLLYSGANINLCDSAGRHIIISSVIQNDVQTLNFLLNHKVDVNGCGIGTPALTWAIYKGSYDVFKLLIENGADINKKCGNGNSVIGHLKHYYINNIVDRKILDIFVNFMLEKNITVSELYIHGKFNYMPEEDIKKYKDNYERCLDELKNAEEELMKFNKLKCT